MNNQTPFFVIFRFEKRFLVPRTRNDAAGQRPDEIWMIGSPSNPADRDLQLIVRAITTWLRKDQIHIISLGENRLVRSSFVEKMERELVANERKGDWGEWKPTPLQVTQELNYHFAKLVFAMAESDAARVSEFSADVANIAMKADEVLGEP